MRIIASISFFLLSIGLLAQPSIPEEFDLTHGEDYAQYEPLVIESLEWLLKNPIDQDLEKRTELNAFVMIWLSGSPNIEMQINSTWLKFTEENEELFFTFLQGMALHQLEHPKEKDLVRLHAQGLNAVARQVIECQGCVKSNKALKKLIKAYKKGKMMSYVEEIKREQHEEV